MIEAKLGFDSEIFQTREGQHQVVEGAVFERGKVNPRMHDFLRIITKPGDRQKGDPVVGAVIRNKRDVVRLRVDRYQRRRRTNRSSPAVGWSLEASPASHYLADKCPTISIENLSNY